MLETSKRSLASEWQTVNEMYERFQQKVQAQITEITNSELRHNITQSLDELRAKIESVIEEIKTFLEEPEKSSKQLLKMSRENFAKLQKSFELILKAA
jgi:DNA anti-recombination protein RmuC